MPTPKVEEIVATFGKKDYDKTFSPRSIELFHAAMKTLVEAQAAGEIYNVEFQDAKGRIASACEHAEGAASQEARERKTDGSVVYYGSGDVRNDIGSAYGMNQAAKLARRLRKLDIGDISLELFRYIDVLEEIAALFVWLKEFKAIVKKGRRPNLNKTNEQIAAELVNTGICPICDNRQKLDHGKMVMHGYQMSDYNHSGVRMGKCFGVGYKAYELSDEGNVAYAPVLEKNRKGLASTLKTLKSGTIVSIEVDRTKRENGVKVTYKLTLTPETHPVEFKQEIENQINMTEWRLDMVKSEIKANNAKIADWKFQPLMYGGEEAVAAAAAVLATIPQKPVTRHGVRRHYSARG